jgi:hypothetical protein
VVRTRSSMLVGTASIALVLVAALLSGCAGDRLTRQSGGGPAAVAPPAETVTSDGYSGASGSVPQSSKSVASAGSAVQPDAQPMVVSTVGMSLEVKSLDAAVAAVRTLATKYGASISSLSTNAGGTPLPTPQPVDGSSSSVSAPTPGGATITLRIPAAQLAAAEKDVAALGRVVSQSSSQDDVTQQHVDLKARLKNLQAEESRLRTFFLKAKNVNEMLAIEQELSRVRGEIESMQAQVTYLERQAALATMTISLSEPGALVSAGTGGWGFGESFRDGVRAAAYVVRGLITTILAFSPLMLIALVLFFVVRAMMRRRRRSMESRAASATAGDSSDQ